MEKKNSCKKVMAWTVIIAVVCVAIVMLVPFRIVYNSFLEEHIAGKCHIRYPHPPRVCCWELNSSTPQIFWMGAFMPFCLIILTGGLICFMKKRKKPLENMCAEDACGYYSLGMHVLLLIITFGIWQYVWIYRTTKFLNKAPNVEQYNPVSKLLLCLFVPFYQIYWLYKHGQRIDAFSKAKNIASSDFATLCLILGIFIPIVAVILMQDKINAISLAKEEVCEQEKKQEQSTANVISALKEYKELLDQGIITQEEFDAKKKSLLGM